MAGLLRGASATSSALCVVWLWSSGRRVGGGRGKKGEGTSKRHSKFGN